MEALKHSQFYDLAVWLWSCGCLGSLVAQIVKNLLAMQETWVQPLGQEDPLEKGMAPPPVFLPGESQEDPLVKGMAPHSHILAWRIPWTAEPGCSPRGCKESEMTE